MNTKPLLVAIFSAVVAVFFAVESFSYFKTNGFGVMFFSQLLVCSVAVYTFWRNVTRIKKSRANVSSSDAV